MFIKDAKLIHATLEFSSLIKDDDTRARVMVVPYPSQSMPFIPLPIIPREKPTRFFIAMGNLRAVPGLVAVRSAIYTVPDTVILPVNDTRWHKEILHSTFCFCPVGDTASTRRFYDNNKGFITRLLVNVFQSS